MQAITVEIPIAEYGKVATAAALDGVDVSAWVKSHGMTAPAREAAAKDEPATADRHAEK